MQATSNDSNEKDTSDVLCDWLARIGIDSNQFEPLCDPSSPPMLQHEKFGIVSLGLTDQQFRNSKLTESLLFWFPAGLPLGQSVALVSSRLGKQPQKQRHVFDAIRTFCCRMKSQHQFLITHQSVATHGVICRAAELTGQPLLEFKPMPDAPDGSWRESIVQTNDPLHRVAFYSAGDSKIQVDRLLIESSQELRVLKMRQGGNIESSVRQRMQTATDGSVFLLTNPADNKPSPPTKPSLHEELTNLGAVSWYLFEDNPTHQLPVSESISNNGQIQSLSEFSKSHDLADYLLHWTRGRTGPWPEQTVEQFYDDLLFAHDGSNHDRISTLIKILVDKFLIASSQITRSKRPVVSFSAVTVDQLLELRVFRSHLSRWDFEPVGIAIQKSVLQTRGARPVIYGDHGRWQRLTESDKPFFQKSDGKIDWKIEQEWRIASGLDLATIDPAEAFVFVETHNEAQTIQPCTNLTIVVLSENKK